METPTQFTAAPAANSGLMWHFSDTRTDEGRVRFLLESTQPEAAAYLLAEGPGWSVQQRCESLDEAALLLAWVEQLPQSLYLQALNDLQVQQQFYQQSAA